MKAWVIEKFGEPDVFREMEISERSLGSGEVRIQVRATSVNPLDWKIRKGLAPGLAPEFPAILHGDVAGVILEVGKDVGGFKVGDEVYGCVGGVKGNPGVLCEQALADVRLIAKKPKRLGFREAAALPLVAITAWEGLDKVVEQAGRSILVYGGTGGVGHVALQLAKIRGMKVTTTVSGERKMKTAKALGADKVIDRQKESVKEDVDRLTQGKGFDVVFDTVGGENLQRAMEAVCLGGTIINIQARGTHDLSLMHTKGLSLHVVFMLIPLLYNQGRERHEKILTEIAELVDQGKIRPLVDEKGFSFSQIAEAHRYAESGQALGKVVVVDSDRWKS